MNDSPYENLRIYAQLKPDAKGTEHLAHVQSLLPETGKGRAVPVANLHMTLIHFGKVFDVYESIRKVSDITYREYAISLAEFISNTEADMPQKPFLAHPKGFARFGHRGGTLVIEYDVPQELKSVHASLYKHLVGFLHSCDVPDVHGYMSTDLNFMHAETLRPHITLYKGYAGELPVEDLFPVLLYPMPTVYPALPLAEDAVQDVHSK